MMFPVMLQARILPLKNLSTRGLLAWIALFDVTMLLPSVPSKISQAILSTVCFAAKIARNGICRG